MKYAKLFVTLLLFVIGVTVVLSLIMPTSQKLEKTTTINAPAAVVYEQLAQLTNFNKWSVWGRQDSSVVYTISGADGTVNAFSSWKGDPAISGEGRMTITSLEPGKKVVHAIQFISPRKGNATSVFTLQEAGDKTILTWDFELATPRPWNIFNMFSSIDKTMGKDFEDGLATLKKTTEQQNGTADAGVYKPEAMNFPATRFAVIRQQVKLTDISAFFARHLSLLYGEAQKAGGAPSTASGLYYTWDEKNSQTDMAVAVPVSPGTQINTSLVQTVNIPASKAIVVSYPGPYDKIEAAYKSLDDYAANKQLKRKSPVIEQYISGPFTEKDSTKWLTRIVYLVE